ncbi:hypothetical protein RDWZM_004141, partial [Blomia tropicalis]
MSDHLNDRRPTERQLKHRLSAVFEPLRVRHTLEEPLAPNATTPTQQFESSFIE